MGNTTDDIHYGPRKSRLASGEDKFLFTNMEFLCLGEFDRMSTGECVVIRHKR